MLEEILRHAEPSPHNSIEKEKAREASSLAQGHTTHVSAADLP